MLRKDCWWKEHYPRNICHVVLRGHSFLQGIFPTWGLNSGLLHCRWILYRLSHQGSPRNIGENNSYIGIFISKTSTLWMDLIPLNECFGNSNMYFTMHFMALVQILHLLQSSENQEVLFWQQASQVPGPQEDVNLLSQVLLLFSCPVMSDSFRPHGLHHLRLPCPSLSPRTC